MISDCPFCHHKNSRPIITGAETRSGDRRDVHCCNECGCFYPRPRLDENECGQYIEELGPYQGNEPTKFQFTTGILEKFKRVLRPTVYPYDRLLQRFRAPGGSALDIGAAAGQFCHILGKVGYDAYGLEPSSAASAIARSHGLNVFTCAFPRRLPDEIIEKRFSLISCFETIYYFGDLRNSLDLIFELLEPGGHFIIKCHQPRSRFYEATGSLNLKRYSDYVQAMPTFEALNYWLKEIGFKIIHFNGIWWLNQAPDIEFLERLHQRVAEKISGTLLFGKDFFLDKAKADSYLVLAVRPFENSTN